MNLSTCFLTLSRTADSWCAPTDPVAPDFHVDAQNL
jgi:hypothetical protein